MNTGNDFGGGLDLDERSILKPEETVHNYFVQHTDSSGHVNLFPPAYPAMNLYRVIRDDLNP